MLDNTYKILSLQEFIVKSSCDMSEELEKLWNIITKQASQDPLFLRSEEAKVEYLHDANDWAK